jgi:TetR/AcrR family transcriptional regulator
VDEDQAPASVIERTGTAGSTDRAIGRRRVGRENLARILKAAEHVFAETGFGGATMAEIAEQAELPKANLHYYFGTKEELYRAVLDDILTAWLTPISAVHPEADPAEAFTAYIRSKMEATRSRPQASRVYANEMLHGAPQLQTYLSEDLRRIVEEKAAVLDGWIAAGKMAPVDTRHFFFMIWALTQHYADFAIQVRLVLDKTRLDRKDWDQITAEVTRLVLRAAGLAEGETGSEHRAKGA